MKTSGLIAVLVVASTMPALAATHLAVIDGSAAAIRKVVAGKTCIGEDVIRFGKSGPGAAGTFDRAGRPPGEYRLGYGTILIRRGDDLHGHVTSVTVSDNTLYMSRDTYHCEP